MSKCFENCEAPNRYKTLLFSHCMGFFSYVLGLCVSAQAPGLSPSSGAQPELVAQCVKI